MVVAFKRKKKEKRKKEYGSEFIQACLVIYNKKVR